jgi:hypothetical protein
MAEDVINLGATPDELASRPGLILDLSLAMVPRRVGITTAVLSVLGDCATDKVASLIRAIADKSKPLPAGEMLLDHFRRAREIHKAVAKLEDATLGLVAGRLRYGMRVAQERGERVI